MQALFLLSRGEKTGISNCLICWRTVVLGLLTTKSAVLEDASAVEARLREASQYMSLERLALSPQCSFASVEAGNPLTPVDQGAKLRLVNQVARRVWRA